MSPWRREILCRQHDSAAIEGIIRLLLAPEVAHLLLRVAVRVAVVFCGIEKDVGASLEDGLPCAVDAVVVELLVVTSRRSPSVAQHIPPAPETETDRLHFNQLVLGRLTDRDECVDGGNDVFWESKPVVLDLLGAAGDVGGFEIILGLVDFGALAFAFAVVWWEVA